MSNPIDDHFGEPVRAPQREDKIHAIVAAAFAGMAQEANTATEAEVFSACLTLCATALSAAHALGAEPAMLRSAVYRLLLRCPEDEGSARH